MKRAIVIIILIFNLALSCKSSQSKTQLLSENKALKERIKTLEADKSVNNEAAVELKNMNVVYRGVSNLIYISKPNVLSFEASAPGLSKVDSLGNYVLSAGLGNSVDIVIHSTLQNGKSSTEIKTLRIKDLQKPKGTLNGNGCDFDCVLILTKAELIDAIVGAKIDNFLYDTNFTVTSFKIKMPNYKTLEIEGNKMNLWANDLFTLLKPDDLIQIFDIKIFLPSGRNYRLKGVSPIQIRIIE